MVNQWSDITLSNVHNSTADVQRLITSMLCDDGFTYAQVYVLFPPPPEAHEHAAAITNSHYKCKYLWRKKQQHYFYCCCNPQYFLNTSLMPSGIGLHLSCDQLWTSLKSANTNEIVKMISMTSKAVIWKSDYFYDFILSFWFFALLLSWGI